MSERRVSHKTLVSRLSKSPLWTREPTPDFKNQGTAAMTVTGSSKEESHRELSQTVTPLVEF